MGGECAAEITAMCLCNLRLGPGGGVLIGGDVPLPLFWRQYAHHEDPRRNAGANARVTQVAANPGELRLKCEGTNAGGEIISEFTVMFSEDPPAAGYIVEIHGTLLVAPGKKWEVTHNPGHGELEFCNIWPVGTFSPRAGERKRYTHCFIQRNESVTLIPHTHLESPDKRNILMHRGDRLGWLLEDENPVVELLSDSEASAGLCAYMWDAHLGYRAAQSPGGTMLGAGSRHSASIRISRIGRDEGAALMARGVQPPDTGTAGTPVYVEGVNTFRETLLSRPGEEHALWPWTFEVKAGEYPLTRGTADRSRGYDDTVSLRISSGRPGRGRWSATTLGPAFGGPPFGNGKRYRLSAFASSASLKGTARAGLRIHREGAPGLGDPEVYELFWSGNGVSGDSPWTLLEVITPPISPPPDRVHILLDLEGEGIAWFDNVLFEIHD